jgi:hypothetical protein
MLVFKDESDKTKMIFEDYEGKFIIEIQREAFEVNSEAYSLDNEEAEYLITRLQKFLNK